MVDVFSFNHSKKIEKKNYFISLFVVYLSETSKAKLSRLEDTCFTAKLSYGAISPIRRNFLRRKFLRRVFLRQTCLRRIFLEPV